MKTRFIFLFLAVAIYVSLSFVCFKDGFFPHPRTCHKYIECVGGVAYEHDCPVGSVFNINTLMCDSPLNVDCEGPWKYTETIRCECVGYEWGFRLRCNYGADFSGVSCSTDSPCYDGVQPSDICEEPESDPF